MFYILKVWICTCFLAPILPFLFNVIFYFDFFDWGTCLALMSFGLLFSIPTFIILFLIKLLKLRKTKYILNTIGVLGVILSFYAVFGSYLDFHLLKFMISYSLSISIFIWFFKLDKPQHNS